MDREGTSGIIKNHLGLDQSSSNEEGNKSSECVGLLQSDEKQKLDVLIIDVTGEEVDEELQANLLYEEERKILIDRYA